MIHMDKGEIMEFAIFGAQSMALGVYLAFQHLYPNRKICCFLVSKRENNPLQLAGISVLELSAFASGLTQEEKDNLEILIATPENVMDEIEAVLTSYGFNYYVRQTSLRWARLMGYYYMRNSKYLPLSALPVGYHRADMHIFMAKFVKDKPLTEYYPVPRWVTPVQVGAALCKERVADVLDCEGDNISEKNGNYSELTALYWIWKTYLSGELSGKTSRHVQDKSGNEIGARENESGGYYGLCHYRRMLELSEDDVLRLADNDVDVVLPYPMPYEPNIEEHHKRYLSDGDWKALLTALEEIRPDDAAALPAILKQQYLYHYNIILAKKHVLAQYCQWLFPVLERVEQLSEPKGWERKDRYIGYMGETLATLYFMLNKDKRNIVYTGCRFLT